MRILMLMVFLAGLGLASRVHAEPCGGGTLDIAADSDTPFTLPTFNVGQMVRLAAAPVGIMPTALSWSIDGPLVKDYNERVGEASTGALPWSTSMPTASDLAASPITFYWKPSSSQIHPLNGGPVTRNVTLTATVGGATCTVTRAYSIERNTSDPRKQANDYYTSNHRRSTETVAGKGVVIDDHIDWHEVPSTHLVSDDQDFFRFHRAFIGHFNSWRAEFGYPPVAPWYPGTPYPPGIDDQAFALRSSTFSTDANQLYRPFTIAGGSADPGVSTSRQRLADFTDANDLDTAFEFTYHGLVHCNVGTNTTPPGGQTFNDPVFGAQPFGDMCNFSSPKDPIFYPWHDFVDLVYENLCVLKGLSCPGTPPPATDVWMADNAVDLAANGTVPSPPPHYISPDIWNRTAPVSCTPPDAGTGALRDCGSAADHENPIAGQTNYLYATLRNDRPGAATAAYTEVAVYVANASTGLAWPANFGGGTAGVPLDESRHFITLELAPGQTTAIGPLPWTPPNPAPSDHWCLYIRALNVQDALGTETADVDANTAGSNSLSWRNLKIVTVGGPGPNTGPMAKKWPFDGFQPLGAFVLRNVHTDRAATDIVIHVPGDVAKPGTARLLLATELAERLREAKVDGLEPEKLARPRKDVPYVPFRLRGEQALISGIVLEPQRPFAAAIDVVDQRLGPGAVTVEQRSNGKVDGGILFQVPVDTKLKGKPSK